MQWQREPKDWLEDLEWHFRMYRPACFQWAPEAPHQLALQWLNNRLVFDRPADVRFLDRRRVDVLEAAGASTDAMVPYIADTTLCPDRAKALELIGLTDLDLRILKRPFVPPGAEKQPYVAQALKGWPLPNPFSLLWELKQVREMWQAADDLVEDTFADLVLELVPQHGWHNLAQLTRWHNAADALQFRVEDQRRGRGAPGDPRRAPATQGHVYWAPRNAMRPAEERYAHAMAAPAPAAP